MFFLLLATVSLFPLTALTIFRICRDMGESVSTSAWR